MKKNLYVFYLLLCFSLFPFVGRSETDTYRVNVGEFSKLKVVNDINVKYVCNPDSAGVAVFTCDSRFADGFLFVNKNGTLKISLNTDYTHLSDYMPALTVYSTFLTSAENQSKYDLDLIGVVPCPEISVKVVGNGAINANNLKATKIKASLTTGNGTVTITGESDFAEYEMLGTGRIIAQDLKAETVNCKVFGTGSISCWPIETLHVKGLGSTTVYYKGDPMTIKKSGIAKIEPLR